MNKDFNKTQLWELPLMSIQASINLGIRNKYLQVTYKINLAYIYAEHLLGSIADIHNGVFRDSI